jgi:outer membrane receptor protein involved in Fe transport
MPRSMPWARRVTALAVALVLAGPAFAGTTGKLTGKVTDDKRQPLPGVNVRVEGQRLGGITDDQGEYFIIGIPGGRYTVRMNLIGYAPHVAENVEIKADFSTTLNASLKTEAVQLNEVRVDAERPLLQRDATSTTRFLSGDDIQKLPTRGYREAVAQQSGVVNFSRQIDRESTNGNTLILRGGRPNETAYFVDGFSQQDPLTGNSTTTINNNAIEEVVLLNGGFNAEYGRIMSGVVNVITKQGGERYSGSLEAITDNLSGRGEKIFNSHIYDYNLYDAAFGGPLVPGRELGSFYLSGQRRWQFDRAPSSNYKIPLNNNSLGGWTGQGKLTLALGQQADLKLGLLNSEDDWREYRNSFRFNLAHTPRYEDTNQSYSAQLNHRLNSRTFWGVGATFFKTERKRGDGVFFDDLAGYSRTPNPQIREDIPWFYPGLGGTPGDPLSDALGERVLAIPGSTGALWDDYLRRQSQYWAVRGDVTSQVNSFHQFKVGGQADWHELRFYQNYFPSSFAPGTPHIDAYGFDEFANEGKIGALDGPRRPFTASAYLQDRYERGGLVANIGLRYDYLNVNTQALKNENSPLGPDGQLTEADLTDAKTYGRISPRIGIGFPVTDKTVLHVNWGQFYQQPNLQDLYVSYRFLEYMVDESPYFVPFGNPNLKPEMTTAYEVGIAHQLNDFSKMDISVYYKDVRDLVQVQNIQVTEAGSKNFASYRNKDFATLKGVDLGFSMRRVNHISGNLAYSLSFAKGTGSVSNSQRNVAWTANQAPHQTSPLDFDQRHKVSVNVGLSWLKDEGPKWGTWNPLGDVDVNVLYNVATGTPYTPTVINDEVTQLNAASQPTGSLNSRTTPATQTLDFKVAKGIRFGGTTLSAFAWVLNAFDTENSLIVYQGTGSPYTTGFLQTDPGRQVAADLAAQGIDPEATYRLATQAASLFSFPRTIRFGLRTSF